MSKFLTEFKEFAVKGNALDMAVGVIIGAAFGKIVSSIVDDIIMPPIGWLIGGVDFSNLKITLPAEQIVEGVATQPATINYGLFIQNVIDFLIVALCVFLLVKAINKLTKKKEQETPAAPPRSLGRGEAAHRDPRLDEEQVTPSLSPQKTTEAWPPTAGLPFFFCGNAAPHRQRIDKTARACQRLPAGSLGVTLAE